MREGIVINKETGEEILNPDSEDYYGWGNYVIDYRTEKYDIYTYDSEGKYYFDIVERRGRMSEENEIRFTRTDPPRYFIVVDNYIFWRESDEQHMPTYSYYLYAVPSS